MSSSPPASHSLWSAFLPLLPLTAVVFLAFLAPGMMLPVVPRHVHDTLGMSTLMVGIVMGSQFVAALFARMWAGEVTDGRGAKLSACGGALGIAGVGLVYLASLLFLDRPALSVAVLIAARLCTGVAESFVITAMLSWGIARVGPEHAGKVIGWVGMALFAAYAAGAPLGTVLHTHLGFGGVALASVLIGLGAFIAGTRVHGVAPGGGHRPPFYQVLNVVKLPGLGLTLGSAGYATVLAFITLLFDRQGWGAPALAFTCMGAGFIVARLLFGHLPDQAGGARVALYSTLAVALGQLLVWLAFGPWGAFAGAALTGGGYALAFQAFGVEAVRRAPPQSRGAAMGGYVAFQDIAMLTTAPLGGVLAGVAGLEAVYFAAAVAAVASAAVAWTMR